MKLTPGERKQLEATLAVAPPTNLSSALKGYQQAAEEEYIRMILGPRVFTRGLDVREYRLLLLIKHVFGGRLPSEQRVSALFQTTASQSRALIRAVMSKYQYELEEAIKDTLKAAVDNARPNLDGDAWLMTVDSENIIDALNQRIAAIDGTLPPINKARGTVSTYEVQPSAYEALKHAYP